MEVWRDVTLTTYILDELPAYLLLAILLALGGGAVMRGKWYGAVIICLFLMSVVGSLMGASLTIERAAWYSLSTATAVLVCYFTRPRKAQPED